MKAVAAAAICLVFLSGLTGCGNSTGYDQPDFKLTDPPAR
jgi:hypothetical protein